MCKRLSLLNHKETQYFEFFGTQVDSLAADIDNSFFKIHGQFRSLDFGKRLFGSGTSQRCSNARQQFSDGKRLYDIIVRPRIQSDNLVMLQVADCHHDNGSFKGQSNLAASLKPAHVRHVYIQKNQIGALADNHFDGLLAVLRLYDVIAVAGERRRQDPTDLRLVVNYENGCIVHRFAALLCAPKRGKRRTRRAEQSVPNGKGRAVRNA